MPCGFAPIPAACGFLWHFDRAARGPEPSNVALLRLGFAGRRTVNHSGLTFRRVVRATVGICACDTAKKGGWGLAYGTTSGRLAHQVRLVTIAGSPGFLRLLGSFGISIPRPAGRAKPIHVALLGLGFAGQRSVNHGGLTLRSGGPCDRGNLCPRSPNGPERRGILAWAFRERSEHQRRGAASCSPKSRDAAMAAGLRPRRLN
jgi:hypothetical protein